MVNTKNTGERLVAIETKMDSICDSINEIKETLKAHVEKETVLYDNLDKKFDKKYAPKWIQPIVWGILTLILAYSISVIFGG